MPQLQCGVDETLELGDQRKFTMKIDSIPTGIKAKDPPIYIP